MFGQIQSYLEDHVFSTANGLSRRPELDRHNESHSDLCL